ncbi:MAG: crossover junction endodeoxyribonuclease RuvC [Candidatus Doudnabacteria bacterium]|nr:crossover junction endodeoxyribonuclease RuvC [Candidatus Doudnabacteria bacterium]
MIILGIDPGLGRMGYAIIKSSGSQAILSECGCITTPPKTSDPGRLLEIKNDLEAIIKKWKPEVMCIESLFFAANSKTAMSVGQARGVALVVAAQHGLDILEMTPLQVKIAITGYGKAEKTQVQKMLLTLLKLQKIPKPDDAADAAAIAWAGIGRVKLSKLK